MSYSWDNPIQLSHWCYYTFPFPVTKKHYNNNCLKSVEIDAIEM